MIVFGTLARKGEACMRGVCLGGGGGSKALVVRFFIHSRLMIWNDSNGAWRLAFTMVKWEGIIQIYLERDMPSVVSESSSASTVHPPSPPLLAFFPRNIIVQRRQVDCSALPTGWKVGVPSSVRQTTVGRRRVIWWYFLTRQIELAPSVRLCLILWRLIRYSESRLGRHGHGQL